MNDHIYCEDCRYSLVYDEENTLYLKCPACDKVLVDRRAEDVWKEPLTIASYGKNWNGFWINIKDSEGNTHTCWRNK